MRARAFGDPRLLKRRDGLTWWVLPAPHLTVGVTRLEGELEESISYIIIISPDWNASFLVSIGFILGAKDGQGLNGRFPGSHAP